MNAENNQTSTALKWLYEMEVVNSPMLQANLYENIFLVDQGLVDCAVWIVPAFTYQKGIMVWIKLNTWSTWFRKEEIRSKVKATLNTLLPSYQVRIVEDKKLIELAKSKIQEVFGRLEDEKPNTTSSYDSNIDVNRKSGRGELSSRESPNLLSDSKEQTENKQEICNEAKQLDPQVEQKAQNLVDDLYSDPDGGK